MLHFRHIIAHWFKSSDMTVAVQIRYPGATAEPLFHRLSRYGGASHNLD